MESRLAEVVDKTVIVEVDTELSLCSCESDVVDETCSLGGDDTCGERMSTTSEGFVKILDFRHFERFFSFSKSDRKTYKKAISDGVNVSVVLDMVSRNTSK